MKALQETIREIRQHSRQLVRELDVVRGVYQDSGYTVSQCHVLFELDFHGSLNLMELAEHLLIDKSNTSRTVKKLVELGLVQVAKVESDQRQKIFKLTAKGAKVLRQTVKRADHQVAEAIENLSPEQRQTVIDGMRLYAEALRRSRLQDRYSVRKIQKADNPQVARLIRLVMTEFQAVGAGYSIDDPEVDDMYANYRDRQSCYYVIVDPDSRIVGCGGIGPLQGSDDQTCELRKMFFDRCLRGIGWGRRLLLMLLQEAAERGYRRCYLETLDRMWQANALYKKNGFELLEKPLGNTGHCSCDRWYLRSI